MKMIYKNALLATMLLFMGVTGTNAQNVVLKNDKGSQTVITYSKDMKAFQTDDQMVTLVSTQKVKPQVKGTSPTHTLNVHAPVGFSTIWISDGINLIAQLTGDEGYLLSVELEEGTYYIEADGYLNVQENGSTITYVCIWTLDNIELTNDMDVYVDFNECVYDLSLDFVDEDGHSFIGLGFVMDIIYDVGFYWMEGIYNVKNVVFANEYSEKVPRIRFNGFDEHSYIITRVNMEPGYQKSYHFNCPISGMHESQTLTVTADELNVIQEQFTLNVKVDSLCLYYTDVREILNANGAWTVTFGRSTALVFDPKQPYTIVSNAKINDPNTFPKTVLLPSVYEWIDPSNFRYDDRLGTALYFNGTGFAIRDASPFFRKGPNLSSYPDCIPETPASIYYPLDKLTFFGERTPLATYYPAVFNSNNTPLGETYFYGSFFFSGEQSCERSSDYDSFIRVCVNGEEIFNNYIYKFNTNFNQIESGDITVEVINDHLTANDVDKTNRTNVEFCLDNDDAMPPTMTFLRVLDGNGDENIWLDRLYQSSLIFACGDFGYHFNDEEETYDHLVYVGKPELEVYWAVEEDVWQPLDFSEIEFLFHENYGNVFFADLIQLENQAVNQWVSLKFVATDEAGNTQTQELSNVFYAGEMVSVNEHIVNRLQHEVYPNPFNGEVKIMSSEAVNGNVTFNVYNVLGVQVYHQTMNCTNTTEFVWDGSQVGSSIYFYSISTESGVLQGKIVKE